MNSLVKKGYVKRERSEKDRRVVFIQLTNKGRMAYHHHAEFHRQMTEAVLEELNEDETEVLVKQIIKSIRISNKKQLPILMLLHTNDIFCPKRDLYSSHPSWKRIFTEILRTTSPS